jgi:DinB superfamily
MDTAIQERFGQLERAKMHFLAELEHCSPQQLGFKADAQTWCMTEVGQHLVNVESGLIAWAQRDPPQTVTLRGKLLYWIVQSGFSAGVRVKTPSRAANPTSIPSLQELRTNWDAARLGMTAFLEPLSDGALSTPKMRHPVVGAMTLEMGLGFFESHIRHHQRQLMRIQHQPGFPKA